MSSELIKKHRESAVLEQFRQLYKHLPRADIIPSERPDFILQGLNGAKLGIELTQLHETVVLVPPTETLVDRMLAAAKTKLDASGAAPVYVSLVLNDAYILEANLTALTDALLQLIAKFTPRAGEFRIVDFPELGLIENYPFINRILIYAYPGSSQLGSIFHTPRSLWFNKVERSHVERSLAAKEKKYPHYREQANQVWLLIELNGYFSPTQSAGLRALFSEVYYSSFERVFVLNCFENMFYPLTVTQWR